MKPMLPLIRRAGPHVALLCLASQALVLAPACETPAALRPAVAPPARLGADGLSRTRLRHTIRVQPTEQAGAYRIDVQRSLHYTVRSRRELGSKGFAIYESPLVPVKNLRALMNGRVLPNRHIERETVSQRHVFIDDARIYRIHYPITHFGTTIGYRYDQSISDPALLSPVVVPTKDHLALFELTVHHPAQVRVDFRAWRPLSRPAPVIYRGATTSRWVLRNVHRRPALPYYPFNGLAALVLPVLQTRTGPLQPITPVTHARWYRALFQPERPLSARHKQLVRKLVAKAASPLEKVRALHEFVRKNVRYIAVAKGMGRLIPTAADTVLDRRWGDCKDMANLLRVLGDEAGLKIDLVLVGTRERPLIQGVIHTFLYNHIIASYLDGGRRIYFDPTASDVPFGQLPEADIGAQSLLVDDHRAVALRLPAPVQDPTLELEINAHSGRLHRAVVRIVVRNRLLRLVRLLKRKLSGSPLQLGLRRTLESAVSGLTLRKIQLLGLHDNAALLYGWADLRGFLVQTPRGLYLPRVPFDPYDDSMQTRTEDTLPLMFSGRPHYRLTLHMTVPGFTVPKVRPVLLQATGVASYRARLLRTPQGLLVTYQLRQLRKRFTGDSREQMIEFHRRLELARTQWFRLGRGGL
jgi:hypothetical protein